MFFRVSNLLPFFYKHNQLGTNFKPQISTFMIYRVHVSLERLESYIHSLVSDTTTQEVWYKWTLTIIKMTENYKKIYKKNMHLQLAFRLPNKCYDFFLGGGGYELGLYYLHITNGDCQVFLLCSLYCCDWPKYFIYCVKPCIKGFFKWFSRQSFSFRCTSKIISVHLTFSSWIEQQKCAMVGCVCPALLDLPDVSPLQRGTTALNMQWYITHYFSSKAHCFENKHLPYIWHINTLLLFNVDFSSKTRYAIKFKIPLTCIYVLFLDNITL